MVHIQNSNGNTEGDRGNLGSLKRFETTGEISLRSLLKLAAVLGQETAFLGLFEKKQYQSISENFL